MILMLVGITAYGYRQLVQRGLVGLSGWQEQDLLRDPLLLLAPTLFLFTAPLVASEIFVLLVRPLALIGRLLPSVTGYLGLVSLGREGGQYRTPTYLLVLCLSLGVFYASLAKSADIWDGSRARRRRKSWPLSKLPARPPGPTVAQRRRCGVPRWSYPPTARRTRLWAREGARPWAGPGAT